MKWSLQIVAKPRSECPKRVDLKPALDVVSRRFDLSPSTVCLRLVDAAESAALNLQFRGKDHPTNVLSFPFEENDYLGDLVLCHPLIHTEALAQGKTTLAHYLHLIVHGLLHLLGFDHDNDADATEMEQIEIDLLALIHIANPYEDHHD
jgi:probable rRNA maturation factor